MAASVTPGRSGRVQCPLATDFTPTPSFHAVLAEDLDNATFPTQVGQFAAREAPSRAWVVAGTIDGWASIGQRLAVTGSWRASRTIAFEGLADPLLSSVAGFEASEGLSGSLSEGTAWTFRDGLLVTVSLGGGR